MSKLKRADIRRLKRAASDHGDGAAVLQLLERSVRFGHKKLALRRCLQAERLGIAVTGELLSYCQAVADNMPEHVLRTVLRGGAFAVPRKVVMDGIAEAG